MKLKITVDIDLEKSGLDSDKVQDNIVQFTEDLVHIGAVGQGIYLSLSEIEYERKILCPKL